MATRPVTISPPQAQAAGCTATCADYPGSSGSIGSGVYLLEWDNFECSATPVAGWAFSSFAVTIQEYRNGSAYGSPTTTNYYINPTGKDTTAYRMPYEYAYPNTSENTYARIVSVVATFVRAKTHLLVNSANKTTPVRLLYYPATNLLVADY